MWIGSGMSENEIRNLIAELISRKSEPFTVEDIYNEFVYNYGREFYRHHDRFLAQHVKRMDRLHNHRLQVRRIINDTIDLFIYEGKLHKRSPYRSLLYPISCPDPDEKSKYSIEYWLHFPYDESDDE